MKTPATGELVHLVTWEYPSTSRDPQTGQLNADQEFTTLAQRYAKVVGNTSVEKTGEQPQVQTTYTVTQRYLGTLDNTCRMNYLGHYYYITGIINVDLRSIWQVVTVVDTSADQF